MQETQESLGSISSLGRPREVGNVFLLHSSILTWKIPLTEEPGDFQYTGSQRVRHHWQLNMPARQSGLFFFLLLKYQTLNSLCEYHMYSQSDPLVLSSSGLLGDMSPIKDPTAGSPNWISVLHCISSPCTSLKHLLKWELSEHLCNCLLDPHLLHLILSLGEQGPGTLFL